MITISFECNDRSTWDNHINVMLKWIVPPKSGREASADPPAPRPNSTGSVSSTSATSRVTDDPLAAIGIHQPKSSLYSKLSLPFHYGRREEEEIYSVTR
jgi:hypothetical protein